MWVIIAKSEENPEKHFWIDGVFKNRSDAEEYSSVFHKKFNFTRELREIPAQDYPIMFVSDWVNFDYIYVTPEELAERLFDLEKTQDEDHQYCIYYNFRKDYRSISPGEDYLGMTDHHHVDNQEIKSLIQIGLRCRLVGRLGIYNCDQCNRYDAGILSEKGYGPPPGWQIILEKEMIPEKNYIIACSEDCRKLLEDAD